MEFTWPVMLVGLAGLPLLLAGWWALRRYQARAATAFADPHLLPLLQRGQKLRVPHLPFYLYLLAIGLFIFASARPVGAILLPANRAAVILAVDMSKSMVATDLQPSRLEVAKQVAREFLRAIPRSARVGLVSFSDYAQVLVRPTTQHQDVLEALDRLQPTQATSLGSAILTAVRALPGREGAGQELLMGQPGMLPVPPPTPSPTAEPLPPGAILLISDGVSNFGVDPFQAAQVARRFEVKIYTVGVGTPQGSVQTVDGQLVFIPFDPTGLQQIAAITGGRYFYPPTGEDLRRVYRELGRSFGWERQRTELSALFAAAGGLAMMVGGMLSLMWYRRLP
ncbi:MAG: VWA domain-containing protein [Armatimonadota bacterium]|nr:VWA domain-containing protein [Armatimonadota bacterium]MDR7445059.1 VWA domain-containing protein [Armatimonadota bacterium]MDR7569844.1 VWA domain-containing protein [Armatimonadota bacterium]MDR7614145.1 VWA domain-containing protein [Armatimonadota bacterium]